MTAAIAYSTPAISRSQIVEKPCLRNLLIFSQDRALCHAYNEAASALGYTAATSGTAEQALYLIDSQKVDVVLLDKNPPAAHELEMLQKIKSRHPEIEVIVATSYGTVDSAVQAMKAGAYDYLTKPFGLADLKLVLEKVAAHLRVKTETRTRSEQNKTSQGFGGIIGRTAEMAKLYRLISKASQISHPVLILGESGTGKEMVARAIHYSGPSRDKPFIPVDCAPLFPRLLKANCLAT